MLCMLRLRRGLDFEGMCHTLGKAPPGSAVLLHACAHNPTGVDPTPDQWTELSRLFYDHRYISVPCI